MRGQNAIDASWLAGAKVLLVTHFGSEREGSRRACTTVLEMSVPAILEAGGDAHVAPIRAREREREDRWLSALGGELIWVPLGPRINPFYVRRLRQVIDAIKPDIVHCHFTPSDLYGSMAALGAQCKPVVVVTAHSLFRQLRSWRLLSPIYRRMIRRGLHVTGVSSAVAHSLAAPFGMAPDDIPVLLNPTNAIDPPAQEDQTQAKVGLGLQPETLCVGFFGRVIPEKRVDTLIRAFAMFRATYEDSALIVAGGGEEIPKLQRLVDELGIGEFVRFTGPYTDVRAAAAPIDVVVMPSEFEGLPIASTEAAMMALPLVSSDIMPMQEVRSRFGSPRWPLIVLNGHSDVSALCNGIAEVVASLAEFRVAAGEARTKAIQVFTQEAPARLVTFYQGLIAG